MNRHTIVILVLIGLLALTAACGGPAATATTAPQPTQASGSAPAALAISGAVEKPLSWSLAELKSLGTVKLELMHPKTGKTTYEGVRLSTLLNLAKPAATAKTMTYSSSDGYKTDVVLADALKCADCMIAFDGSGVLTAAMPGMEGAAWAKTLVKIEIK